MHSVCQEESFYINTGRTTEILSKSLRYITSTSTSSKETKCDTFFKENEQKNFSELLSSSIYVVVVVIATFAITFIIIFCSTLMIDDVWVCHEYNVDTRAHVWGRQRQKYGSQEG